jgi:predicted O-methyltransferase YrrM
MPLNKPYGHLRISGGYVLHLLSAKGADGIHSPFVFNFYTRLIKGNETSPIQKEIENYRKTCRKDKRWFTYKDFGTGNIRQSSISKHARHSAKSKRLASILYRVVKAYQPKAAIELGSNLGIGLAYMQSATKNSIASIEGIPELHKKSKDLVQSFNMPSRCYLGSFKDVLPNILNGLMRLDFVFVDGDHSYEGTRRYFELLLPFCHENTVLIFDDIHWSSGMEKAWLEIQNHPRVTRTLDGYFLGFVFFNSGAVKQHFQIRL